MIDKTIAEIINNITSVLEDVKHVEISNFINALSTRQRIFFYGAGRSGLVAKAFAMRLMHLGFVSYIIGETITPALKQNDLLVVVSGSGKTISAIVIAETAKSMGVNVVVITSHIDSPLAKKADYTVKIAGRVDSVIEDYNAKQLRGKSEPLTPMGTTFELSSMIFFDAVIAKLMLQKNIDENEMVKNHANVE